MAEFSGRTDDNDFSGRLRRQFGDQLVPLPATEMMTNGAPSTPGVPVPIPEPRFKFDNGGQARPVGGPTPYAGGPGPQVNNGGQVRPVSGEVPPTAGPGVGTRTPDVPVAESKTPSLDDLRTQFQTNFVLGEQSSNLANPDVYNRASSAFNQIIAAAGGNPDLINEIGQARYLNRLQEFLGKGTTLDQSGRINVGNGVVLDSLRSLGDFGQPVAAPSGTSIAPRIAGVQPATGVTRQGVPQPGVTQPTAVPTLSAQSFAPQEVAPAGLGASSSTLQQLAQTGGVNPNLLFEVEKSLRESSERTRSAEEGRLTEDLARRRIGGSGVEAQERGLLSERLAAGINTGLRDFATSLALQGSQNQLSAAETLAGLGTTQRGQDVAASTARRGQDVSLMQSQAANALRQMEINNNFALGQAGVYLQNLALNTDFMNALIGNRISLGDYVNASDQAARGNTNDLLALLLGAADSISRGATE